MNPLTSRQLREPAPILAPVSSPLAAGGLADNSGETLASMRINLSTFAELTEITDPAAPLANQARVYLRDNGAGKTQLVVVFPTGAVQQIAIEP